MLSYIATQQQGRSTREILGYMGLKFGLKFKTTSTYIEEMDIAGVISESDLNKWQVTRRYKELRKLLYSE